MKYPANARKPRTHSLMLSFLVLALFVPSLPAQDKPAAAAVGAPVAAVDLRPQLTAFGLTPLVQGKRGTCSVFAMTQAIEFAFAKKENRGQRFSAEFLNWASNRATKDTEDGGFFSDLWTGFAAYGICLADAMPYEAAFNAKIEPSPEALKDGETRRNAGLELHWIKAWDPKCGLSDDELRRAKEAIGRGWPVCGGFLWPKKAVWTEGVLAICPRDQVFDGHSLLLVGYKDDPAQPGGGVFLIRNSGGSDRDGFVTYEYAKTYMNDAVWIDIGKSSSAK